MNDTPVESHAGSSSYTNTGKSGDNRKIQFSAAKTALKKDDPHRISTSSVKNVDERNVASA